MLAPQYTHKKWLRIKFAKPTTLIKYNPKDSLVDFSEILENWNFFISKSKSKTYKKENILVELTSIFLKSTFLTW